VWRLSLVIVFGAFMSGLDASVVGIALPTLSRDLGADLATTQWVANAYLLALAVSLPACGWMSRRVGPGRVWLAALAGFTVASGLCALALPLARALDPRLVDADLAPAIRIALESFARGDAFEEWTTKVQTAELVDAICRGDDLPVPGPIELETFAPFLSIGAAPLD
jgi:MFS family permease